MVKQDTRPLRAEGWELGGVINGRSKSAPIDKALGSFLRPAKAAKGARSRR
jgi:hypothetical protein